MIQRIQSIYLLLGAVLVASLFLFDTVLEGRPAQNLPWFAPAVTVLVGLIALIAVFTIFRYKNRPQQRQLIFYIQVLTLILLAVLVAGLYFGGAVQATGPEGISVNMVLAVAVPVAAYVFFFFARRGVEKDIALVRSIDRLR